MSNHIFWLNGTTEMTNGKVFSTWKALNTNVLIVNKKGSFDLLVGDSVIHNSDSRRDIINNTIINKDSGEVFFKGDLVGFTND